MIQNILQRLGEFLKAGKDLYEPLSDLRLSILLLLMLAGILLYLDPGQDVVRSLVDTANSFISDRGLGRGASSILVQWVAFWAACVWLGTIVWYWSGILYRSKRGRHQPMWFRSLRRVMGIAPLVIAISAFWVSSTNGLADVWIGTVIFVVTAALMYWLFTRHTAWSTRRFRARAEKNAAEDDDGSIDRLETEDHSLGRGGVAFVSSSLAISAFFMVLFCLPSVRTDVAWMMGPAAIAFLAVACIVPVVSLAVWFTRPYNIPVIAIGFLLAVIFSCWNDNHEVRSLSGHVAPRLTIQQAFAKWEAIHPNASDPVILIATAGGASRAAYWTGTVLRALEDNDSARNFSQDVFAISSVSGGSLGAVGYAAWVADHPTDINRQDPLPSLERRIFVQDFFGQDYLGPAVAGLLYPDLFQRFFPAGVFPSRAASLEEGWEQGWNKAVSRCTVEMEQTKQPLICSRPDRMSQDFLAIWDKTLRPNGDAASGPWVPIVLVNGTHVETGKRIITAPVAITPDVFEDSYDFFNLHPNAIRASTAILNSARFPIVSPAGTMGDNGHIVDGGYFENGGLETLLDLAQYLRSIGSMRPIVVIEINNDDSLSAGDAARHKSGSGALTGLPVRAVANIDPSPVAGEITSIIGGLYGTRDGRGVLGAKRASRAGEWLKDIQFYQFRLGHLSQNSHTTMSWAISPSQRDRMDVVFNVIPERIPQLLAKRHYSDRRRASVVRDLNEVLQSSSRRSNVAELDALMHSLNDAGAGSGRAVALKLSPGS